MTLLVSRHYGGNQWLVGDTLISGPTFEGQLAWLPSGPVPAKSMADGAGIAVTGMASKLEIFGKIAIASCGNLSIAKDAIQTVRSLYEIGHLDLNAVRTELTRAIALDEKRPAGFLVHSIEGDGVSVYKFDRGNACGYSEPAEHTFCMGSGAEWFRAWLDAQPPQPKRPPEEDMRQYHSEIAAWLASDVYKESPLARGFGGMFDTIVPTKNTGEWEFSRLAETTVAYWPVYDEGWVLSTRNGRGEVGGNVLVPNVPSVVYTKDEFRDGLLIRSMTRLGPTAGDWLTGVLFPLSYTPGPGNSLGEILTGVPPINNTRILHVVVSGVPLQRVSSIQIVRSYSELLAKRISEDKKDIWLIDEGNGNVTIQVTRAMQEDVMQTVRALAPGRRCTLVRFYPDNDPGAAIWCKQTVGATSWASPGITAAWEVVEP